MWRNRRWVNLLIEQSWKLPAPMTNPLAEFDLQQAIDLRWTLRDIKAKRWVLSPINPSHLEKLITLGLVEMRNDSPVLTNAGLDVISAG
jgi:hypothetical protein